MRKWDEKGNSKKKKSHLKFTFSVLSFTLNCCVFVIFTLRIVGKFFEVLIEK